MSTIAIIAWIFTIYVPAIVLAVALSQAAGREMPEPPAKHNPQARHNN